MGGKKQRKPGKGKEKTERKTAKAAEKRARRDDRSLDQEDDIDAILASIQKEEAKKTAVHVEENVAAPSPRCNCSVTVNPMKDSELVIYGGEYYIIIVTVNPMKDSELVIYGGEYYNGDKTYVYGDLYRYNTEKGEWKLVCSPNSPPPRSAHQAVAWKNSIFMFGGEFTSPNQERFHHYKDLWRFDLNTNAWEQLVLKGSPSARSGHRMVLYKHKIILFGGFYDTLREVRYFNDLHVLDLDEYKWLEIKPKLGMPWPSPRSGFQFAVYLDEIFLYGGYFKDANAEKDGSSEKAVVHADMWVLDPRNWEWNKVKKSGMPPGPRAGFSMCTHKKRAILFGGVVDAEEQGDLLCSTFLNEIYAFQMDNHRWYPLELRKAKAPKQKKAKNELKGSNNSEHGIKGIESSSIDNLVEQVEIAGIDDDDNGDMAVDSENVEKGCTRKDMDSITVPSFVPQLKPCARINACMAVARDTLYLYGGLMEVGDREVTLDDLFALDLNKLDEWKCLIEASKSEWIDPDNEEDEEEETDSETGEDSGDEDEELEDETQDQDGKSIMLSAAEETAALIRGEGKKMLRKERKQKIESLRSTLGLADLQRTPKPGESLKDFFGRTNMYWQMAAYEHTQHTGKELRKDGFDLAESRYKELKPVLDELAKLEAEQKEEEEEKSQVMRAKKAKEKARSTNR